MTMKKTYVLACMLCLVLTLTITHVVRGEDPAPSAAPAAAAAPAIDPVEILKKADKLIAGMDDSYMKVHLTTHSKEIGDRETTFEVYQKGTEKRLIRFLAPGEVKGQAVLIQSRDHMYVYLPDNKRIRRVAAHNMNQSFGGSDFTNDDMAQASYAADYIATMEKEDENFWWLHCSPRPGLKTDYTHVVIKVEKSTYVTAEIAYYKGGEKVRLLTCGDAKKFPGTDWRPTNLKLENLQINHSTTFEVLDYKINQGYKDDMFTERYLQWAK
jgi:outer membrane lipoprotein-sorting protein